MNGQIQKKHQNVFKMSLLLMHYYTCTFLAFCLGNLGRYDIMQR